MFQPEESFAKESTRVLRRMTGGIILALERLLDDET